MYTAPVSTVLYSFTMSPAMFSINISTTWKVGTAPVTRSTTGISTETHWLVGRSSGL